jgi:hypothetical protein
MARGPNLDALVAKHGGYDKIPPEAWKQYDREVEAWHLRRRDLYSSQTEDDYAERPK